MRKELETIEYIERYLLGLMNTDESNVFEYTMNNNEDFKNEVELQAQLVQGLERISLQQTIQNAQKTYTFWKLIKLIGMILIPLLLVLLSWYFLNTSAETTHEAETIPTKVEQLKIQENSKIETKDVKEKTVSTLDTIPKRKTQAVLIAENNNVKSYESIPSEIFTIQTEKDTILETQNGIVFLIPNDAFVDSNQQIINGSIQLEIKEALDPMTIMTSGLTTLHNGKLLETGGMFFVEATKDSQQLEIHPEKEIIADIPTFDYKNDMQLFDGKVLENGTINWVNPKPLEKTLIPHDIQSLNFYPPNYLETLSKKGYDITDKKFTDSLYYSFRFLEKSETVNKEIGRFIDKKSKRSAISSDTVMIISKNSRKAGNELPGLDPLKVKTIWNERYQHTFIATKAFEERLKMIHTNCKDANYMLDVYLKNLDRDLHVSDSIIAYSTYYGEAMNMPFLEFSRQRLTNIANVSSDVSSLNNYYVKQQKVYRLALEKTQQKMDSLLNIDTKYQTFSKNQLQNYYLNELAVTTQKVAKDIDVKLPQVFNEPINGPTRETSIARIIKKEQRKRTYRASVRSTGWKNIDQIINGKVITSVQNRTTTTIQNKNKEVTITYSSYSVSIENKENFDNLFVYVVPNEFTSFIRLEAKNNSFNYKLNDLLKYRVYCIAYLDEIPFYFSQPIKSNSEIIKLTEITKENLAIQLSRLKNQNSTLETEISYQVFKRNNSAKLKRYREIVKLKRALESIVFPCAKTETVKGVLEEIRFRRDTILRINLIDDGQ